MFTIPMTIESDYVEDCVGASRELIVKTTTGGIKIFSASIVLRQKFLFWETETRYRLCLDPHPLGSGFYISKAGTPFESLSELEVLKGLSLAIAKDTHIVSRTTHTIAP